MGKSFSKYVKVYLVHSGLFFFVINFRSYDWLHYNKTIEVGLSISSIVIPGDYDKEQLHKIDSYALTMF